jgi:dipeptidyl aminopeptidase/acylaminoacyl peptidase
MPAEAGATARDVTPGDADWPTWRIGGGGELAFSNDGSTLYVSHKPAKGEAWRTNGDLYAVPTAGGAPRALTADNPGDDQSPVVSPDGRWLAYRSQRRDGYESDLWRLRLYDLREGRSLPMAELPEDAGHFRWKRDSSGLVVETSRAGRSYLTTVTLDGHAEPFSPAAAGSDFTLLPDGAALVISSSLVRAHELYRLPPGGKLLKLTSFNDEQFGGLLLGEVDEQWVTAGDGAKVHSLILRPSPTTVAGGRAPLLVLVHGGPQGAWSDSWGLRWNAAIFAARGYVVLMPNPRGSTGYGAPFKEGVSKDWGGQAYDDLMRSVDEAEKRSDVLPGHTCAAGASYGGYLINWIAGHTKRFACLVSHAGVFDLVSEYGTTEELWFPEWELGGPYWENPDAYRKWSPSSYVKNFATPTLVTLGELDFRVPMEQGLGMFTALQRRGVPSRLLTFPDEGHWVNKPRNALVWYRTVLEWVDAHARPQGGPRANNASPD